MRRGFYPGGYGPSVIGDEKPVVVRKVCSKGTADKVKNALKETVTNQGTAPLARVDGVEVAGKTGTAQAITPDGYYYRDKYVASFVGFFPVENPRYVCLVVVDQADLKPERNFGGLVAAPIFAEVAGKREVDFIHEYPFSLRLGFASDPSHR